MLFVVAHGCLRMLALLVLEDRPACNQFLGGARLLHAVVVSLHHVYLLVELGHYHVILMTANRGMSAHVACIEEGV